MPTGKRREHKKPGQCSFKVPGEISSLIPTLCPSKPIMPQLHSTSEAVFARRASQLLPSFPIEHGLGAAGAGKSSGRGVLHGDHLARHFVLESNGCALTVLTQQIREYKRPCAYFSATLDTVAKAFLSCLKAVAAYSSSKQRG
ncbi:hypothetical protein NDU88_004393 [Pleurodeles waltl]|uniref:Uncharacterized protein n=1 Tax=Pleurodeles waltl TaxID=8319 RepID=A0AAV7KXQ5_PLEWA|nr:hypothetical protein NDU88_004393 [Pleurodeles waltl]